MLAAQPFVGVHGVSVVLPDTFAGISADACNQGIEADRQQRLIEELPSVSFAHFAGIQTPPFIELFFDFELRRGGSLFLLMWL